MMDTKLQLEGCFEPIPSEIDLMRTRIFQSVIYSMVLLSSVAWAQAEGSVEAAFQVARKAINPEAQTKVVSAYGMGSPTAITKWYFIFYDPAVKSHGRAVLVENKKIVKAYPATGGMVYSSALTFDPSRLTSEGPALNAAELYAAKHQIKYDSVHALLKQKSVNRPFRWQIELLDRGASKGYVMVNTMDNTVASYVPTTSGATPQKSSSAETEATGFANDVKKTFVGVGGDLEEFFTGKRTVDK